MTIETLEIETAPQPSAAVIWLHGLGADGHDFETIVPELGLPASKPVRFIFPHAPRRPVTINNGMHMRAWYDILQLATQDDQGKAVAGAEDEAGIRASQGLLEDLIAREKGKGIAHDKIVLAGFSQGGAIVLQTALRQHQRLAGVLALSTYLPLATTLEKERAGENSDLPIFMAHGRYDNMISLQRAARSRDALLALGYAVQWQEYPMPHSVCPDEIADIAAFLLRIL
ncbi:MAG: carboxylesterase [Betaproteobacteria bacterium]|nr:carboxylesterase [Betaproteobacteria bacterium]